MGRFNRILVTAGSLWREQRRWRFTVIGAAMATVGAFVTGSIGGGGSPAPMPGGGAAGSPLVIQPTRAVDAAVDGRLRQFYQAFVTASTQKAQAGLWCEQVAAAYLRLEPGDEASASGAQTSAINETKQCLPLIADSNGRLEPVAAAYKRFESSPTVAAGEAVTAAAARLTDFDRSRAAGGAMTRELSTLGSAIETRKKLLASAAAAAPLYRPGDPATLATATQLAEIGTQIQALPFAVDDPGLDDAERRGIAAARAARSELADGDRRIAVLAAAYPRRREDAVGLALALGALTPVDRARMGGMRELGVDLPEAERAARDAIGTAMERSAGGYAKNATFDGATQLTQLATLAQGLGADIPASANPALDSARRDLAGSGVRLAALRETASHWEQGKARGQRDPNLEAQVARVLAAIVPAGAAEANTFDGAAMSAQDRAALATLIGASIEIHARVPPAQRRSVSIAMVTPANADAAAATFFTNVASALERVGFTVSPTASKAVIVLTLSPPGIQEGGISAEGLPQRRASVRASMRWTYSGRTADLGTITGIGINRDSRAITEAALRAAAEQVAKTVLSAVESA